MPSDRSENASPNIHRVVADWLFQHTDLRRVLDVPAGSGAFAQRCAERGLEAWAGDCIDEPSSDGVTRVSVDLNGKLPFADGLFDAVVCIEGIEHLERPFDFVRECRRVLRPGGVLVLTTPNVSALRSRWRWWLTGFHNKCKSPLDETNPNPLHHIHMLSFPMARYLLHTSGFRITDIRTNRYKLVSLLFAPWVPVSWLATWLVFRHEEDDPAQRARDAEILRQMHSAPLLFGETMILMAEAKG